MTPPTDATMRGGTGSRVGLMSSTVSDAVSDLTDELWTERDLVDQLLFVLTNQQLILRAGAVRWLTAADLRVRAAVKALTQTELRRAVAANRLAVALGLDGSAGLDDLAAAAPPPWDLLLADHCDVLRALSSEVAGLVAENTRMLRAGAQTAYEALATGGICTQVAHVDTTGIASGPTRLTLGAEPAMGDPSLDMASAVNVYRNAVQTVATVERQSLRDFLR